MYFSSVGYGVGRFGEVEGHKSPVDVGLEMMVHCEIFDDAALILGDVFIRPDAVVGVDCVISEIEKSLGAKP